MTKVGKQKRRLAPAQTGKLARDARAQVDERVLAALRRSKGKVSMGAIARALGTSQQALTLVLRRLVAAGQVREEVVTIVKKKVDGHGRSKEDSRVYAAAEAPLPSNSGLPAWLSPQAVVDVGERRLVYGRVGLAFARKSVKT